LRNAKQISGFCAGSRPNHPGTRIAIIAIGSRILSSFASRALFRPARTPLSALIYIPRQRCDSSIRAAINGFNGCQQQTLSSLFISPIPALCALTSLL
jgi:hypothetical protein